MQPHSSDGCVEEQQRACAHPFEVYSCIGVWGFAMRILQAKCHIDIYSCYVIVV